MLDGSFWRIVLWSVSKHSIENSCLIGLLEILTEELIKSPLVITFDSATYLFSWEGSVGAGSSLLPNKLKPITGIAVNYISVGHDIVLDGKGSRTCTCVSAEHLLRWAIRTGPGSVLYKQIIKSTVLRSPDCEAGKAAAAATAAVNRAPNTTHIFSTFYQSLLFIVIADFGRTVCISNQFYSFRRNEFPCINKWVNTNYCIAP